MGICITETYLHFSYLSFCYIQLLFFRFIEPLDQILSICYVYFNDFVISCITILLAEILYMHIYGPLLVFILGN